MHDFCDLEDWIRNHPGFSIQVTNETLARLRSENLKMREELEAMSRDLRRTKFENEKLNKSKSAWAAAAKEWRETMKAQRERIRMLEMEEAYRVQVSYAGYIQLPRRVRERLGSGGVTFFIEKNGVRMVSDAEAREGLGWDEEDQHG